MVYLPDESPLHVSDMSCFTVQGLALMTWFFFRMYFQRLADHIEGSRAAKLAKDSNNVVSLIRDNYRAISSEVKMVAESEADDVKVNFFSRYGTFG